MKASEVTLGGILISITIIILYSTYVLPISTISVLTMASAIVPICIIKSNIKTALFVFVATSIISFFILPINIWLLYSLIFGGYGIIKYLIERMRKDILESILKFIYFNIIFFLAVILSKIVLGIDTLQVFRNIIESYININNNFILIIIPWLIWQVVFFLFDYALTLIISFYIDRFHKKY